MSYAKKMLVIPLVGFALLFGLAGATHAQLGGTDYLGEVGSEAGIDTGRDLPEIIGQIIQVLLGFLGVIFLVLVIYAGFLWMTAAGNSDQVDKAKTMMVQAIIGLLILLAAWAITQFVITNLGTATGTL